MSEIEAVVGPDTILVSNTSALSITEMGRGLRCPNRFAGMHFFSPVHRMPLVEVIRGEATDDQTIATVVQFAKLLKKTPIVVKNGPGFLVNRLLIPYVNEAVRLLEEGVAIQTVDSIMTAFGMPLGPLALADEVGLDVGYKVAKILHDGLGDRMTVADSFERINQIDQLKGKKSGLGFYRHENGGSTPNADIESVLVKKAGGPPSRDDCLDRLVLTMVNEAARCVDEGVVASAGHLDLAMVMGTGFPPYRMGLCRYADEVGIARVVDRLHELAQRYGDRFSPCQRLVDMAARSDSFYKI